MSDQQQIEEALFAYSQLKEQLGRVPSSREFRSVYSQRKLSILFLGGNAYSRLQQLAGDSPNKFSSSKSALEDILIQWGDLSRETLKQFQKLPTQADWSYYNLRPSVSGIEQSHKIKWSDIPSLFFDSFSARPEWNDVIANISTISNKKISEQLDKEECFLYLMKDLRNGSHKIGISSNPLKRERTLQSEQPKIELIAVKKYINRKIALAIEKALHDIYSHKRKRGEWFELDEEDTAELLETLDDPIRIDL